MKQFFTLLGCLVTVSICAQPGTLDKSFGKDGKTVSPFDFTCSGLALQKDGKILAGGVGGAIKNGDALTYLLTRYHSDGSIDLNFGDSGRAVLGINFIFYSLDIPVVAVQPDGKIVAAGRIATLPQRLDVLIARFNTDGSIDKSFGEEGMIILDLGWVETTTGLALQEDGKILVSGIRADYVGGFISTFTLRFLSNGEPDNSFGDKGKVFTTGFGIFAKVNGIGLHQDKIFVGITDYIIEIPHSLKPYIILRYNSNGTIDSSYGINGKATLIFSNEFDNGYVELDNILVQQDGQVLATGTIGKDTPRLGVARFTADGFPDSSFGTNGFTSLDRQNTFSEGYDVFTQDDGRIIAGGYYYDGTNNYGAVRFLTNGVIDSSYGENGVAATFVVNTEDGGPTCALLQPDGKMLVGGMVDADEYVLQGIVRFNGNESKKPVIFTKIKRWLHHHGITWDDCPARICKDLSYYSVERSANGNSFSEIARIVNRNGQLSNSFEDATPLDGTNYYRLSAVSTDGSVVSSNVIAVEAEVSKVKFYPNPVQNDLHIEGLSATKKTKLTIIDFMGNVKARAEAATIRYDWNISGLKPGNYLLRIETEGKYVVSGKFVKE